MYYHRIERTFKMREIWCLRKVQQKLCWWWWSWLSSSYLKCMRMAIPLSLPLPLNYQTGFIFLNLIRRIRIWVTCCIESTVTKDIHAFYIDKHILECLFNDPMHPKNYPINFGEAWIRCYRQCYFTEKRLGADHVICVAECYKEKMKKFGKSFSTTFLALSSWIWIHMFMKKMFHNIYEMFFFFVYGKWILNIFTHS